MTNRLILSFLLLMGGFSVKAQLDTIPLTFGSKFFLASKILNDKEEVWIRFPDSFETVKKDSLSLLILLDGDEYFKIASDVTELYEWSEKMPKTIIIGLPSSVESRWKYYTPTNVLPKKGISQEDSLLYRSSGSFERYADFISKELIPKLSKELNTTFMSKTVFGHSNGGLGAISFYVLRPEIFDNYIAASPSILWDNYYLQKQIGIEKRNNPIYVTIGNNGWDYNPNSFVTLRTKLDKTSDYFKFEVNNDYDHANNGLPTLLSGLQYIYGIKK